MVGAYVALLRSVNVGGRNRLPMSDLAEFFREAGCSAVRTYIQSGNVVFAAEHEVASRLADTVGALIQARFGWRPEIVLRSADELEAAVRTNPLAIAGGPAEALHLMFMAALPAPEGAAKLDPLRSPPDEFELVGRELYLKLPGGVTNSKLTGAYFESKLGVPGTARNWRTVTHLLSMARELAR